MLPRYLIGVLVAFVEPVVHGGSNILDHFLSSKVLPRLSTLVFFGSLISLCATTILVFATTTPHLLSPFLLGIAFFIAAIEVTYLFPYYYALREIDTSVVASLFSLGKIVVPVLAFYFLGERLHALQYVGFFLIIGSSFALSFDVRKLRVNHAFLLMAIVSLILAFETILYKYAYLHGADWGSFVLAMAVLEVGIASAVFMANRDLKTLGSDFRKLRSAGGLYFFNEALGWTGTIGDSFALTILPATVSRAIGSTQSLFVLLYAYLFKKKRPELFNEAIGARDIAKKFFFFLCTLLGVILVLAFGTAGA